MNYKKDALAGDVYIPKGQNLRTWTTKEMAQVFEVADSSLCNIKKKIGVKGRIIKTQTSRRLVYDFDDYVKFKQYFSNLSPNAINKMDKYKHLRIQKAQQINIPDLEELKAMHPLVTDVRFFQTTFFPDTIPSCFAELEDEKEIIEC